MWKFKKGAVVFVKETKLWGHVLGLCTGIPGHPRVTVELENGSRYSFYPNDLETEDEPPHCSCRCGPNE